MTRGNASGFGSLAALGGAAKVFLWDSTLSLQKNCISFELEKNIPWTSVVQEHPKK